MDRVSRPRFTPGTNNTRRGGSHGLPLLTSGLSHATDQALSLSCGLLARRRAGCCDRATFDKPIAVVCAGAKSVLDLPRTLEALETPGVPIVGFGTDEFPAFYSVESGIPLEHRVDDPAEVAAILEIQAALNRAQGVLVVQPPRADEAIPLVDVDEWIEEAVDEAERSGVVGKAVTPFLLERVSRSSEGRSVRANVGLLESNARLAARIAGALG